MKTQLRNFVFYSNTKIIYIYICKASFQIGAFVQLSCNAERNFKEESLMLEKKREGRSDHRDSICTLFVQ